MAPDDADGAAGGVDENALERAAVPPGFGVRRVGIDQRRGESESRETVRGELESVRIAVERHHLRQARTGLEHVRRLAAGRRAGVEDALSGSRVEVSGRKLRRGILHGDEPVGVTRQARRRRRFLEQQR